MVKQMSDAGTIGAVYVPETGEMLLSDEAYRILTGAGLSNTAAADLAQLEQDLVDQIEIIKDEVIDYFLNYPPRTNGTTATDHPNSAWQNDVLEPTGTFRNSIEEILVENGLSLSSLPVDVSTIDIEDILELASHINGYLQDKIVHYPYLPAPGLLPTLNNAVDAAGYEDYLEIEKKIAALASQITGAVDSTTEIRVTYTKNSWLEGDLRPEHYFACISTEVKADGTTKTIDYNPEYLNGAANGQIIEYDVGYNQRIRINTLAEDVFKHELDRNIDDLENAVRDLLEIERIRDDLNEVLSGYSEGTPEHTMVKKQLDAAQKAYDYMRDNVHRMFERSITIMQKALDDINIAVTDSGTRSARLDLISNRLLSQKTTFEILRSENEDIDIAEIAIKLTSTELSYNAALMATGKIMQTSLMNYI
jgi:flagellin-like hook-associated protein FlgL